MVSSDSEDEQSPNVDDAQKRFADAFAANRALRGVTWIQQMVKYFPHYNISRSGIVSEANIIKK